MCIARAPHGISRPECDRLFALLTMHVVNAYAHVLMPGVLIEPAMLLTQQQRLRGYDAVSRAAARATAETVRANGLPDLRFVRAGNDLLAAAPGGNARRRQLILQRAVQGGLVEQDPRDAPASVLFGAGAIP